MKRIIERKGLNVSHRLVKSLILPSKSFEIYPNADSEIIRNKIIATIT
jgi:hypothetical protein